MIHVGNDVGSPFALWFLIFRIRVMTVTSPMMCFDFGVLGEARPFLSNQTTGISEP